MNKMKKFTLILCVILAVTTFTTVILAQDTKYISEVKAEGYNEQGKLVWEGDVFVEGNETNIELNLPKNVVEIKLKPVASSDCKILSINLGGQAYSSSDKIKINENEVLAVIKASLSATGGVEKEYTLKLKKREVSTDATLKRLTYNLRTNDSVIGSGVVDDKIGENGEIVINIPSSIASIYFTTYITDDNIKNKYINVKIFDAKGVAYEQVNGISEAKYTFGQEKEAKFTVKTTAEDGITSKEYIVKIIKDKISSDTSLGDVLTINTIGKDSEGYDKTLYTVDLDTKDNNGVFEAFIPDAELKAAKKFDIFVTAKNPTSKIQVVQNNKNIESYDIQSYYITTTDPLYINVVAEDGTKKQYTLKIISSLFAPNKDGTSAGTSNDTSNNKPEIKDDAMIPTYIAIGVVIVIIIAVVVILLLKRKKQYSHMDLKDFTKKK